MTITENQGSVLSPLPVAPVQATERALLPAHDDGYEAIPEQTRNCPVSRPPRRQEPRRHHKRTRRGRTHAYNTIVHALRTHVEWSSTGTSAVHPGHAQEGDRAPTPWGTPRRPRTSYCWLLVGFLLGSATVGLLSHLVPMSAWRDVPILAHVVASGPPSRRDQDSSRRRQVVATSGTWAVPTVPVVATVVRTGDLGVYLTSLGSVTAFHTVVIRPRVDGQLIKVAFQEGQVVRHGELVAEIDPRPFQMQLAQSEGQLAKDDALLQNAKVDLARYKVLLA